MCHTIVYGHTQPQMIKVEVLRGHGNLDVHIKRQAKLKYIVVVFTSSDGILEIEMFSCSACGSECIYSITSCTTSARVLEL